MYPLTLPRYECPLISHKFVDFNTFGAHLAYSSVGLQIQDLTMKCNQYTKLQSFVVHIEF